MFEVFSAHKTYQLTRLLSAIFSTNLFSIQALWLLCGFRFDFLVVVFACFGFIGGVWFFCVFALRQTIESACYPKIRADLKLSLSLSLSLSLLYSKVYKIIKKSAEMNVLIRLCFILVIGFFGAKNYL